MWGWGGGRGEGGPVVFQGGMARRGVPGDGGSPQAVGGHRGEGLQLFVGRRQGADQGCQLLRAGAARQQLAGEGHAFGLVVAPTAAAEPPFRLHDYVTDNAGVLNERQLSNVQKAVDQLYADRRVRLWVWLLYTSLSTLK